MMETLGAGRIDGIRRAVQEEERVLRRPILGGLVGVAVVLAGGTPRDSSRDLAVLTIDLPVAATLGGAVVTRGRYRLTIGEQALVLTDPETMQVVATIPYHEEEVGTAAEKPAARVAVDGTTLTIVVTHLDRVYTARGSVGEVRPPRASAVQLAAKKERTPSNLPQTSSKEEDPLDRALRRYWPQLRHCTDRAQKRRWTTDHPLFHRCVCPLTQSWRLPKSEKVRRVHRFLLEGRFGVSLTVAPRGRVVACRVWAGREPPPERAPPSPDLSPEPFTPGPVDGRVPSRSPAGAAASTPP